MSDKDYDPNLQGSDTPPSPGCEGSTAADLERFRENARESNRQHQIANDLAKKGHK